MYCTQLVKDKAGARPTIDTIGTINVTQKSGNLTYVQKEKAVSSSKVTQRKNAIIQIYRAET
jgi:hypothetical protein